MKKALWKTICFFGTAVDFGICVYILLILGVLPFYFTAGYLWIGTDKALFFRKVNYDLGKVLFPLALILVILRAAVAVLERADLARSEHTGQEGKDGGPARRFGFHLTDMFMALYAVSLILSYRFSEYREVALYGAEGWYMGFFTQMAFVLVYFMITSFWKPRRWMLYLVLPVSAAVFFLGYLDRFGLYLLEMESRRNAFISTIGNINWYCGYAVCVFFLAVVLFWRGAAVKTWQRIALMAYITLGFATLVSQGSEGGILTTGLVMFVLFCLSAADVERMLLFWQEMLSFSGACLISALLRAAVGRDIFAKINAAILVMLTSLCFGILATAVSFLALLWIYRSRKSGSYQGQLMKSLTRAVIGVCAGSTLLVIVLLTANTLRPGCIGALSASPLFTFSNSWGSGRGATWTAAAMCFKEQDFLHKLVGVGPDAMSAYLYTDGSGQLQYLARECFGTATLLTNAHNEWLNILVDVGILGLFAYAGFIISALVRCFRAKNRNTLAYACGFCLLAYTVHNMFSFQQTMNSATIFVILSMGMAFLREQNE